jgi:hypothetical protein
MLCMAGPWKFRNWAHRSWLDGGVFTVHRADLLLELGLHVGEGLDVALEVLAHHPLHGVAIEADHLGQQVAGEHRRATSLFFEDDLQQDVAGQVFAGLGVDDLEIPCSRTSSFTSASVM